MEKYPHVVGGSPHDLNIPLVVKEKHIHGEYVTIIFNRPQGLSYEPGNWLDIRLLDPDLSIGKTYSFASSPTEADITILFKKGVSKFKKALEAVKKGDTLLITQYGSNGFLLNKKYQSLFIAGGVGITPFRSMVKEVVDTRSKVSIDLLFINHTEEFPFKDELDFWQEQSACIKVHYIVTGKEGRLTKEKLKQLFPHITEARTYTAGSPSMVSSIKNMLLTLGVNTKDIKTDSFDGY